jgi:hypothetical protein
MNTRKFLKSLATIAVAPSILIPVAKDAYRWHRAQNGCRRMLLQVRINPAWVPEGEFPLLIREYRLFANSKKQFRVARYVCNPKTGLFERTLWP